MNIKEDTNILHVDEYGDIDSIMRSKWCTSCYPKRGTAFYTYKGNSLCEECFERELNPTTPVDSKPEHKSIEGLRKEFYKKFVVEVQYSKDGNGGDIFTSKEFNPNNLIDFPNIVWEWIEPHLNSRNLLERFDATLVGLWNFFALEKDHHGKQRTCGNVPSLMYLHKILKERGLIKGSGQFSDKGKVYLDEFIESELKQ